MKGVKFGGFHSYYEWGLILKEKELKSPTPKTHAVEIEGADGVLDYTEFFGDVKYDNRQLTFKFSKPNIVPDGFLSLYSLVQDTLHGKKMQVILDDDPAYFYYGRVSINEWKSNKRIGEIVIEVDAEPYKYKVNETIVSATLDGTSNNLYNINNVPLVGNVKKTDDNFFILDTKNTGSEILYPTFRHSKYGENEITPNQSVSFVMEIQSCEVSPVDSVKFTFTSNFTSQPDYFGKDEASFVVKNGNGMLIVFPATIKDSATISNAALFMRSFFYIPVGASIKIKFRISVVKGTVNKDDFAFVSADGSMKGLRLLNSRENVIPTITADNPLEIYYEGESYSVAAGTIINPDIELKEGNNDIAVTGSGTIGFTYREGRL